MTLGIDAARKREPDKFARGRDLVLPASQGAPKHHAAEFHGANAAFEVKRIDEADAGIIAWLQMWAERRRVDKHGVTARQRNAYFSSSDAAFPDRYAAGAEYWQVKAGEVGVEGGWRIYSSGPGIYAKLIIGHVLGHRRQWGRRTARPLLPKTLQDMTLELDSGG